MNNVINFPKKLNGTREQKAAILLDLLIPFIKSQGREQLVFCPASMRAPGNIIQQLWYRDARFAMLLWYHMGKPQVEIWDHKKGNKKVFAARRAPFACLTVPSVPCCELIFDLVNTSQPPHPQDAPELA